MGDYSRNKSYGGGGNFRKPTIHKAVCDQCHKSCEVPFKPTGDKPIYCNACFRPDNAKKTDYNRRDNKRASSNYSKPRSEEREMTEATCSKCKEKCMLPFKPSKDKPVYCSTCFASTDDRSGKPTPKAVDYTEQFDKLNSNLEKLIKILSGKATAKPISSDKESTTTITEKKVVKRKVIGQQLPPVPKKPVKKVVKKKTATKAAKKTVKKKTTAAKTTKKVVAKKATKK